MAGIYNLRFASLALYVMSFGSTIIYLHPEPDQMSEMRTCETKQQGPIYRKNLMGICWLNMPIHGATYRKEEKHEEQDTSLTEHYNTLINVKADRKSTV